MNYVDNTETAKYKNIRKEILQKKNNLILPSGDKSLKEHLGFDKFDKKSYLSSSFAVLELTVVSRYSDLISIRILLIFSMI